MLVLNKQAKKTGNIIFAEERQRLKIFEHPVEKNSLRQTLNFYNHWALLYEISEMIDIILNIGGEPIFDDHIVKFEFHTYSQYDVWT